MKTKLLITAAMISVIGLSGCAHQGLGGSHYTRQEARVVVSTVSAKVMSVREVKLEGDKNNKTANAVGAGIGGIAGASIGKETIAKVAGAALGGFAGYQIASMITSATSERRGIEVVVSVVEKKKGAKAESKLVTVTQELDPSEVFTKGDTVYLSVDKKGVARISKAS